MTLTHRRIIYLLFFVVFFAVAPGIVLYSSGYYFNFKKNSFQETGVLFVESQPKDADIFLGTDLYEKRTPTRITELLPDTYTLKVTKDTYQPWQATLDVRANQTTFIQSIQLFLEDIFPVQVAPIPDESISGGSPQSNYFAWITSDEIHVVHTKQKQERVIPLPRLLDLSTLDNNGLFVWSPHTRYLLLADLSAPVIVSLEDSSAELLARKFLDVNLSGVSSFVFDPIQDDIVYFSDTGSITRANLLSGNTTTIFETPEELVSFFVDISGLFVLTTDGTEYTLAHHSFQSELPAQQIISSPAFIGDTIFYASDELTILRSSADQSLYLFWPLLPPEEMNTSETISFVTQVSWSPDSEKLLLSGEHEIRFYQFPDGDYSKKGVLETLARFSEPITAASWYTDSAHVFFASEGTLYATELFRATRRNTWELVKLSDIYTILSPNKNELFVQAQLGNNLNVYSLEIQ